MVQYRSQFRFWRHLFLHADAFIISPICAGSMLPEDSADDVSEIGHDYGEQADHRPHERRKMRELRFRCSDTAPDVASLIRATCLLQLVNPPFRLNCSS